MTPPQETRNAATQQDMAVLDQVKKQRTPGERVPIETIIDKIGRDYGLDGAKLQMALAKEQNDNPKFRIFRYNNTLFFTVRTAPDTIEAIVETMDKPRDLIEALKDGMKALKTIGVKKIMGDITNPAILKAYQMAGLKYSLLPSKGVMPGTNQPKQKIMVEV